MLNLSCFSMLEEILKSCLEHAKGALGALRMRAHYTISFSTLTEQSFLFQSQLHQL